MCRPPRAPPPTPPPPPPALLPLSGPQAATRTRFGTSAGPPQAACPRWQSGTLAPSPARCAVAPHRLLCQRVVPVTAGAVAARSASCVSCGRPACSAAAAARSARAGKRACGACRHGSAPVGTWMRPPPRSPPLSLSASSPAAGLAAGSGGLAGHRRQGRTAVCVRHRSVGEAGARHALYRAAGDHRSDRRCVMLCVLCVPRMLWCCHGMRGSGEALPVAGASPGWHVEEGNRGAHARSCWRCNNARGAATSTRPLSPRLLTAVHQPTAASTNCPGSCTLGHSARRLQMRTR